MQQYQNSHNQPEGERHSVRTDLVWSYVTDRADRSTKARILTDPARRSTAVFEGDVDIREVGESALVGEAIISGNLICAPNQELLFGFNVRIGGELKGEPRVIFDCINRIEVWGRDLLRFTHFRERRADAATLVNLASLLQVPRGEDEMLVVPGSADLAIIRNSERLFEIENAVVLGDLNLHRRQPVTFGARGRGAVIVLGDVRCNGNRPSVWDPNRFLIEGKLVA